MRCYTAGLPDDVRKARRNEIASDIWEHAEHDRRRGVAPRRTSSAILARSASGVVDDLSWRRQTVRRTRAERRSIDAHARLLQPVGGASHGVRLASTTVLVAAAAFMLVCGVMVANTEWEDASVAGRLAYAGILTSLGLIVLAGASTWQRRLKLGLGLTIAPTVAFSMMTWGIPQLALIAVPFALVGAPWERRIDTGWSTPEAIAAHRRGREPTVRSDATDDP